MRPTMIICACVAMLLVGREMRAREIYTIWSVGDEIDFANIDKDFWMIPHFLPMSGPHPRATEEQGDGK